MGINQVHFDILVYKNKIDPMGMNYLELITSAAWLQTSVRLGLFEEILRKIRPKKFWKEGKGQGVCNLDLAMGIFPMNGLHGRLTCRHLMMNFVLAVLSRPGCHAVQLAQCQSHQGTGLLHDFWIPWAPSLSFSCMHAILPAGMFFFIHRCAI